MDNQFPQPAIKRIKERYVYEAIHLVEHWRGLYETRYIENGREVKYTLDQAAEIVGVPRKTLEDYYYQLKKAEKIVDLQTMANCKMGVLRRLVKESKKQAEDKTKVMTIERVVLTTMNELILFIMSLIIIILIISLIIITGLFMTDEKLKWFTCLLLLASIPLLFLKKDKNTAKPKEKIRKPVNFSALGEQRFEENKCQESRFVESTIFSKKIEFPKKQQDYCVDKDEKKKKMQAFYQQIQDETNQSPKIQRGQRQYLDDSKSLYSQVTSQYYGTKLSINRPSKHSAEEQILQKQLESTKTVLAKVLNIEDGWKKAVTLFHDQFLKTYLEEFSGHLVKVNKIMREHFNRKIIEIDVFFQNRPNDFDSNKNENALNKQSTSLQEVLYLNQRIQHSSFLPMVPISIERFEKEKPFFIKSCNQLQFLYQALESNDQKLKQKILNRLISFNEGFQPVYEDESLTDEFPKDFTILTNLFINIIRLSIGFERQNKPTPNKGLNQQQQSSDILQNLDVTTIKLENFGLQYKEESEFISRNVFLQQIIPSNVNGELLIHFYSDAIQKVLKKQDPVILFTPYNCHSFYYDVAYYLLHINCLNKQIRLQLQQFEYNQQMINCILKMALDFSSLVKV